MGSGWTENICEQEQATEPAECNDFHFLRVGAMSNSEEEGQAVATGLCLAHCHLAGAGLRSPLHTGDSRSAPQGAPGTVAGRSGSQHQTSLLPDPTPVQLLGLSVDHSYGPPCFYIHPNLLSCYPQPHYQEPCHAGLGTKGKTFWDNRAIQLVI